MLEAMSARSKKVLWFFTSELVKVCGLGFDLGMSSN